MRKLFIFFLSCILVLFSCSSPDSRWDKIDNICGQELCYEGPFEPPWISAHDAGVEFRDQSGKKLSCDNKVLETENVLTFSDASSDEVKIQYANMTEQAFSEIKKLFDIKTSAELGIVDLHSKLTIYADRYKNHDQAALAFGFILYALDNPLYESRRHDPEFLAWYRREVKHETMHVMQFLLGAITNSDVWFREGLAEYVSRGAHPPIHCWEQVEEWQLAADHINPVSIHINSDYPVPNSRVGEYYPLFGLAVRYLMDANGQNNSIQDVKNMFADLRDKVPFAETFESHMGIPLQYFENNFFRLIKEFLPKTCEEGF